MLDLFIFWIKSIVEQKILFFSQASLLLLVIRTYTHNQIFQMTWIPLDLLPVLFAISLTSKKKNLTKLVGRGYLCALVSHNRSLITKEDLGFNRLRLMVFKKYSILPGKQALFLHSVTATFHSHPFRQIL